MTSYFHALPANPRQRHSHIWTPTALFEATTGWTAFGNDTTGLATDVDHITGTKSLEFDKVDGAANTAVAGISYTLTTGVDLSNFLPTDKVFLATYVSTAADIVSVTLRLGTSVSHYASWTVADTALTAARWDQHVVNIGDMDNSTGNGWSNTSVKYIALAVTFDAQDDTLADIRWDHVGLMSAAMVGTSAA